MSESLGTLPFPRLEITPDGNPLQQYHDQIGQLRQVIPSLQAPAITAAAQPPTPAEAWSSNTQMASDWLSAQRAEAERQGLWDPATGRPTAKGWQQAGQATATGLVMGSIAPELGPEANALAGASRIAKPVDLSAPGAWDQLQAWHEQQKGLAQTYAAAGKPVGFNDTQYPHLSYLISPEMHEPGPGIPEGAWRVTTFSRGEPYGHTVHNNAYDAFKEATIRDWQPVGHRTR